MTERKKDWVSLAIAVPISITINILMTLGGYTFEGWYQFYSFMTCVGIFFLVQRIIELVIQFRDDSFIKTYGTMYKDNRSGKRFATMEGLKTYLELGDDIT